MKSRQFLPLLHNFPTSTGPIKCRPGLSAPGAQTASACRNIRAKINNSNSSNDSQLYVAFLPTKRAPRRLRNCNCTGRGRAVGKIVLRIFPLLHISRINGLKQIRNRLHRVPLVKQKSNYMMGNCNNPSQASASKSRCCWQCLWASAVDAGLQRWPLALKCPR